MSGSYIRTILIVISLALLSMCASRASETICRRLSLQNTARMELARIGCCGLLKVIPGWRIWSKPIRFDAMRPLESRYMRILAGIRSIALLILPVLFWLTYRELWSSIEGPTLLKKCVVNSWPGFTAGVAVIIAADVQAMFENPGLSFVLMTNGEALAIMGFSTLTCLNVCLSRVSPSCFLVLAIIILFCALDVLPSLVDIAFFVRTIDEVHSMTLRELQDVEGLLGESLYLVLIARVSMSAFWLIAGSVLFLRSLHRSRGLI